jgi:hypothetical protein
MLMSGLVRDLRKLRPSSDCLGYTIWGKSSRSRSRSSGCDRGCDIPDTMLIVHGRRCVKKVLLMGKHWRRGVEAMRAALLLTIFHLFLVFLLLLLLLFFLLQLLRLLLVQSVLLKLTKLVHLMQLLRG